MTNTNLINCDVFIPVRLNNKRLPGKALKKINDVPIIFHLIKRLQTSSMIRNIVVCTTTNKSDDVLVQFLEKEKIKFFRGDEKDILMRFLGAAKKFDTDFIINVDGDDIYSDPKYVEKIILEYKKTNADYIDMEKFPFGFRSVAFSKDALIKICNLKTTNDTETGYRDFFKKNSSIFQHIITYSDENDFTKNLRFTLDYQEDLELAEIIINKMGNDFHLDDLITFLKNNPKLLKITQGLEEKWWKHYNQNLAIFSFKQDDVN